MDWKTPQNYRVWFDVTHYCELSRKHGVGRKIQAVGGVIILGQQYINSSPVLHLPASHIRYTMQLKALVTSWIIERSIIHGNDNSYNLSNFSYQLLIRDSKLASCSLHS